LSPVDGRAVHPISWRQKFGGLKSGQVKRLKDLETENTRLRRAVSDLTLDKLILQEAARGNY
jgi:putative transposase